MLEKRSQSPTLSSGNRQRSTTWSSWSSDGPHRLLGYTASSAHSTCWREEQVSLRLFVAITHSILPNKLKEVQYIYEFCKKQQKKSIKQCFIICQQNFLDTNNTNTICLNIVAWNVKHKKKKSKKSIKQLESWFFLHVNWFLCLTADHIWGFTHSQLFDFLGWRLTNLVHWGGTDRVSQQSAAKRTINTLIHVVQELCIVTVFTCESRVAMSEMSKIFYQLDFGVRPTNISPTTGKTHNSPWARLSQWWATIFFPITLTATVIAEAT